MSQDIMSTFDYGWVDLTRPKGRRCASLVIVEHLYLISPIVVRMPIPCFYGQGYWAISFQCSFLISHFNSFVQGPTDWLKGLNRRPWHGWISTSLYAAASETFSSFFFFTLHAGNFFTVHPCRDTAARCGLGSIWVYWALGPDCWPPNLWHSSALVVLL